MKCNLKPNYVYNAWHGNTGPIFHLHTLALLNIWSVFGGTEKIIVETTPEKRSVCSSYSYFFFCVSLSAQAVSALGYFSSGHIFLFFFHLLCQCVHNERRETAQNNALVVERLRSSRSPFDGDASAVLCAQTRFTLIYISISPIFDIFLLSCSAASAPVRCASIAALCTFSWCLFIFLFLSASTTKQKGLPTNWQQRLNVWKSVFFLVE